MGAKLAVMTLPFQETGTKVTGENMATSTPTSKGTFYYETFKQCNTGNC